MASNERGRATAVPGAGVALLLVLSLGLGLRLFGLGDESLWYDEFHSWRITNLDFSSVLTLTRTDTGPPGHHVLLYLARQVLGSSEQALRLPAALLGALAPLAIFSLGAKLYSKREALVAAALMATLRPPIAYSQEARAYSGVLLLASAASSVWVTLLRDLEAGTERRATAVWYAATATVLMYFHYFGVLLIGLHALAALWRLRRRPRAARYVLVIYIVVAAAFTPWLPAFLAQAGEGTGKIGWLSAPTLASVADVVRFLFGSARLASIAILFLSIYLVIALWRRRSHSPALTSPDRLLLGWLVTPVLLAYVMSWVWVPVFHDRYLLIVAPPMYLLLARALVSLSSAYVRHWVVLGVVTAVCLFQLVWVRDYYASPRKPQVREAVEFAVSASPSIDQIYVVAKGWNVWMLDYYLDSLGVHPVGAFSFGGQIDRVGDENFNAQFIRQICKRAAASGAARVWVFKTRRPFAQPLQAAFEADLDLRTSKQLKGVVVSIYDVPRGGGPQSL